MRESESERAARMTHDGAKHTVAARMLFEGGASGEEVMAYLRGRCATAAALSSALSRVRLILLDRLDVPPAVHAALAPFAEEPGVRDFLQLPLASMLRQQGFHRASPRWSDAAEAALAGVALLPAEVAKLRLSVRETAALKEGRETALLRRQEHVMHVHSAHEWVSHAARLARESTVEMSPARLALPLLLLSGRRSTEVLNGQSTFTQTERPTVVIFHGAIKKRGCETRGFPIPLLCDSATFLHALSVLRAVQHGEQLSPADTNQKYERALNTLLPSMFHVSRNVHMLRSIYASLAFHLYSSTMTFNRAAMLFLGHEKIGTSLSYNRVVLHDAGPPGCFGPLPA